MSKATNTPDGKKTQGNLKHELWGVIFFACGLLIAIALISYFVNHTVNILGPYLGVYLSFGLVSLLGAIPAFLFPAAIIYMGIQVFKGSEITLKKSLFTGLIIIEMCIILAIHNLPVIARQASFPANIIGNIFTRYVLYYVFGTQRFGPYFLFVFALVLSVASMFDINIRDIMRIMAAAFMKTWGFLYRGGAALFSGAAKAAQPAQQTGAALFDTNGKKEQITHDTVKEKVPISGMEDAPMSEEDIAAQALEEELAAFRAKKEKPVTISIPDEAPEDGAAEESEEAEDVDIGDAASIEPSLIESDLPDEEFIKVPSLEEATKKPKMPAKPYIIPSPDILPDPPAAANIIDRQAFEDNSRILEKTLLNFNVEGKVVNICPGPVVTRYEIELAPGIKISKVVNLQDDLSLAVGGKKIRIEAPIPGKAAVGIELPNDEMQMVYFKHILVSDAFRKSRSKLPIVIGKSIAGTPYVADIVKMPHMLIAGQTGSGKSVAINSLICTLLMTKTPEELRLILVDPKKVEMSYYENIPHLLAPVVTESREAVKALQWGVMEMSRRYKLLARVYARNIDSFNQKIDEKSIPEGKISEEDNKKLPFIVIIVDELADLMLTASRDVEGLIQRIAQLARAVGIHLVVSTQRPSVDIITGPIKANLASRIAFRTIQSNDSRTILDHIGAEKLLGRGDMLFLRSGAPDIERYHGAFITEEDVEIIVNEIRSQNFETEKVESFEDVMSDAGGSKDDTPASEDGRDEKFEEAARLIVNSGLGSTSLLQRRLKLGFARAGRLMDELHQAGIVGPQEGSKAREVLVSPEQLEGILKG